MQHHRINIEEPWWDQATFWGRARRFFNVTNPLNLLCAAKEIEEARSIVTRNRRGEHVEGLTEEKLWRAKHVYDSAFHPDTGGKITLIGRMSAQVPMNMTITGCTITFYKTTAQVVFWQWINQSFNAVVNYSNRSGDSPIPLSTLGLSYVLAIGGALGTALGLKSLVKSLPPLMGRFVPFCAVAAANCVKIPVMRMHELRQGIPVVDENENRVDESRVVARWAVAIVAMPRVGMAVPVMVFPPIVMNLLEGSGMLQHYRWISAPLQVGLVGVMLVFATPLCCAIFAHKSRVKVSSLDPDLQEAARGMPEPPTKLYTSTRGFR